MEIVFSIMQETDGGYVAECLSHDLSTQGNTWEDLRANVREAVSAFFFDQPKPSAAQRNRSLCVPVRSNRTCASFSVSV